LEKHLIPYNDSLASSMTLDDCLKTNRSLILALKDVGNKGKILFATPKKKQKKKVIIIISKLSLIFSKVKLLLI